MTSTTITPQSELTTTVRRFFAAWAAGDATEIDALVDRRATLGPVLGLLYARSVYRGRRGVALAFAETAARWDRLDIDVQNMRLLDDAIIVRVHLEYEKYGMSTELPITVICRLRDGRIASVEDV